jgi:hypothetical protein
MFRINLKSFHVKHFCPVAAQNRTRPKTRARLARSKIAGFFGAVIGVVPLAIIAAALKQDWSLAGELVYCLVVTFGAVMFYHRSRCPRGEARGGATVLNPGSPARGFAALTITHYHDRRQ